MQQLVRVRSAATVSVLYFCFKEAKKYEYVSSYTKAFERITGLRIEKRSIPNFIIVIKVLLNLFFGLTKVIMLSIFSVKWILLRRRGSMTDEDKARTTTEENLDGNIQRAIKPPFRENNR